jgi:cytochrome c peroxidase
VARNSPTTFNIVLYDRALFWDGRVEVLDSDVKPHGKGQGIKTPDSLFGFRDLFAGDNLSQAQARFPLTSINEMFGHGIAIALVNQLRRLIIENRVKGTGLQSGDLPVNGWLGLFQQAYSDASNDVNQVVTLARITGALSHYQQTQLLVDNPWFSYLKGNSAALSDDAKRGALLFYKPLGAGGYACSTCHVGNNLSDEKFYNLATPQFGRGKNIHNFDTGRLSISGNGADKYRFRTPSLLNTEVTGPWGHAGAFVELEDVIRHHLNVDASLSQYDYALASLSQYQYVPVDAERIKGLVDRALLVLKTSDEWNLLSHDEVNQDHVNQLAEL